METSYSILLESPQISSQDPRHQNQDPPSAVVAVAAHIRSFYRLFAMIAVLLALSCAGTAAIIVSYIQSNSCTASRTMSRWLTIFGIVDIIMCGFIAKIVYKNILCQV
jgi:hypothetical protein